jgi:hypothetical protein
MMEDSPEITTTTCFCSEVFQQRRPTSCSFFISIQATTTNIMFLFRASALTGNIVFLFRSVSAMTRNILYLFRSGSAMTTITSHHLRGLRVGSNAHLLFHLIMFRRASYTCSSLYRRLSSRLSGRLILNQGPGASPACPSSSRSGPRALRYVID